MPIYTPYDPNADPTRYNRQLWQMTSGNSRSAARQLLEQKRIYDEDQRLGLTNARQQMNQEAADLMNQRRLQDIQNQQNKQHAQIGNMIGNDDALYELYSKQMIPQNMNPDGSFNVVKDGFAARLPAAVKDQMEVARMKKLKTLNDMSVKNQGAATRQQAVDQTGQYRQDSLGLRKESIDQQGKIAEDRLAAQNAWHSDKMTIAGQRLDIQRQAQKQAAEYRDYLMAKGRQDSIVDLKDTYADIIGKIDSLKAKYSSKETYADLEKVARDYEHMIVEREKSAAQPASPAPAPIPAPEPVSQTQPPAKSKYKIIKVE